jgi:hypothetical protein
MLDLKKVINGFDQNEKLNKSVNFFGSMIFMDDGGVVGIIWHKAILEKEGNKIWR